MRLSEQMILYEDSAVIVCHKPAGIPVQTAKAGQPDLVSFLKNHRARAKEEPYIGTVHRIDQPVEGLIAFAKTREAAADLSAQIAGRTTEKVYLAAAEGMPEKRDGTLVHYLVRDGKNNVSRTAQRGEKNAKYARLFYETAEYDPVRDVSLLRVMLDTGRHHQIRVQLSAAGHPLLGDRKYNPKPQQGNVALCASRISFDHPVTGERMTFRTNPENPYFAGFVLLQEPER